MSTFNYQGKYICECGMEFVNSQSFNGHKANCKIHAEANGKEFYQSSKDPEVRKKMIEASKQKTALKKQEKLNQWISEQHACEKCGKIMTEKFGSGRFCCRACANGHTVSSETKEKISSGVKCSEKHKTGVANYVESLYKEKLALFKVQPDTQPEVESDQSSSSKLKYIQKYTEQPNSCCICGKILDYEHKANKTCSTDCYHRLISLNAKGRPRWNIHRNQTSFAEQFWIDVLTNNNINFVREKAVKKDDGVHCYLLDFYIEKNGKMIDLEIDGKQHEERQEDDMIRDEFLTAHDYLVYRVK